MHSYNPVSLLRQPVQILKAIIAIIAFIGNYCKSIFYLSAYLSSISGGTIHHFINRKTLPYIPAASLSIILAYSSGFAARYIIAIASSRASLVVPDTHYHVINDFRNPSPRVAITGFPAAMASVRISPTLQTGWAAQIYQGRLYNS